MGGTPITITSVVQNGKTMRCKICHIFAAETMYRPVWTLLICPDNKDVVSSSFELGGFK